MNDVTCIENHHLLLKELCSLSAVIVEQMCQPKNNMEEAITNELGDVYFRLHEIMKYYDKEKVMARCHSNT
tara:strand:- start:1483 stop:1695 length:213 start_codon:yes stop_codon:yes gene_type:complete